MSNPAVRRWQEQNPELTKRVQECLPKLEGMNTALIEELCDDIDGLEENKFDMFDFLDRCGPRLAAFSAINQLFHNIGRT